MSPHRSLSVVIPVHCEETQLRELLASVSHALATTPLRRHDLIVVDDGSTDGSWPLLQDLAREHPELTALRLARRFGKEAALAAGLDEARGDGVLVMDGDLQHPPELIPALLAPWLDGRADVVEAVKRQRGRESRLYRLAADGFTRIASRLSGTDLRGATDFKLLDRAVVDEWKRMREHNLFFRGMVGWLGFRHEVVPFDVPDRTGGRSGFGLRNLLSIANTAITAFSTTPLRVVTVLGLLFLLGSVVLAVQTLSLFFSGEAVSGFTTVILLLLITGSAVMIGLGVIGEYIARIYHEVKHRPRYVTAERIGSARDDGGP